MKRKWPERPFAQEKQASAAANATEAISRRLANKAPLGHESLIPA